MVTGSYALADYVKSFVIKYDSEKGFFHFDFDVGQKQRLMWIPASALIQAGILLDGWENISAHEAKYFSDQAANHDPLVIHLKYQATTDDGALLIPSFHNGLGIGLGFTSPVWRNFLLSVRR